MKIIIFFIAIVSFGLRAEVKELYLPVLDCGEHEFADVSVTFDDNPETRKEITVSKLCTKLALKLLRNKEETKISRFISDELAPKRLDGLMPRASDFFKILLFKNDIVGRKDFDFTEHSVETILLNLKNKSGLAVRTFSPSSEQMATIAYHRGGVTYFNEEKLERRDCSLINTLVHEYMHFVGYSHGDNSPIGKENSVPYYFGNRAQELCEAGVI